MENEYQYTEAFAELQEIVGEIERGDISLDELSHKVKRAAALIAVCKTKLTATEADVSAILETLKPTAPQDPPKTDSAEGETQTLETEGDTKSDDSTAQNAE